MEFLIIAIYHNVAAAAAKLLQPCRTLCDPIDGSPPGSAVPGILQARTLEWVAISFSNCVQSRLLERPHPLATHRMLWTQINLLWVRTIHLIHSSRGEKVNPESKAITASINLQ